MPLKKSYSEHVGLPSKNRSWQRSKSNPVNVRTSRPLAPVSDKTKSKVNQFQFQSVAKTEASVQENGTENQDGTRQTRDGAAITPTTKLSWHDLMESNAPEDQDKQKSPSERILWNNERDKDDRTYAAALSPMMPRKGRKRARSSSPISSPAPHTKPATPTVNVKKLSEALKSPHADPTLELWDRFSLANNGNVTPLGITNPALANLMFSSSPRNTKDAAPLAGDSSLRRAISCGLNWPKRRRVDRSDAPTLSSTLTRETTDSSKNSLVTALLDTVTGSIHEDSPPQESEPSVSHEPESPSPTKRKSTTMRPLSFSPSRNPPNLLPHGNTTNPSVAKDLGLDVKPKTGPTESDYGDVDFDEFDEFDDDTFLELEASISLSNPNQDALQSTPTPARPIEVDQLYRPDDANVDDEFGDLDDDIFEAAESIIDNAELKAVSRTPTAAEPPAVAAVNFFPQDDLEDVFGDDFGGDFDFDAAELAATQSAQQPHTSSTTATSRKPKAIQRYLVTNVLDHDYTDERGLCRLEKILIVQADNTKSKRTIHLRGDWYETPAHPKAYVHVIGTFSPSGQCTIDDSHNILILHPDQLISATVVADSFTCIRRAVLQDRVKATSEATAPLVYGTMLHEIFQEALMANQWDLRFLSGVIDRVMEKHIEDLYKIKVSTSIAKEHLQSKMTELSCWASAFVASQPRPDAVVLDRNGKKANMCVSKLLDVEEHVWSPMYGLKGNIDATVQVTMRDGKDVKTLTVPFEVKTGKHANSNHMAQTALYNLLLSDRYDLNIVYGVLYYMETSQTMRIPTIRHELRHMIMQRNQLACHIRERSVQLPPMKRSKNMCGKCYAKTSCFIYHKLADGGDGETSGMGKGFDEVVKHLTPKHQEFFLKWENLLTKEEKETQKLKRELWTMVSQDREKVGRCFSDVIIEEGSWSEDLGTSKINRFSYTFVKRVPNPSHSFLESQLAVGEPVVVSDEQGHFALALGYVTSVRKQRISVAVDRRLHNARIRQPGFDESDNQVFASIMEVVPEGCTADQSQGNIKPAPIRYRLDKDEFSNGMATVRNNLIQTMAEGVFGSREIRRAVVDLVPPRFKTAPTQYVVADRESLNVDQHRAIEKVMSAEDYALVLGMPGTGKTTTIAHIIRALVSQGKSVLLTSYTHTAVDNILLKLKNDNMPVLRLGAPAKVHLEVQQFAILAGQPMNSFEQIKEAWHDTPIVATTCLGVGHALFNERTFDYCIVDEASQITLPICLGPIRMAKTFVLVGDHNQLPPLVQNEEAREGGLDVSLFKLLSDTHPDSVVNLEHQYRMCEDIMTLSNTLIYHGRLRCGTEELRLKKLDVPNMNAIKNLHYDWTSMPRPGTSKPFCTSMAESCCWLRDLLDSEARVRFVNTDTLQPLTREEAKGNRIVNPAEARIVVQLVEGLLTVGVPDGEIGVMTHYRSQLSLLKHGLRGHVGVEMHTADRFQGRDKDVVILSLVRSNESCSIGELLKDWRRINVAFTRAKTKLLVIGSKSTLKGSGKAEMLSKFISLMEERDWIYDLPPDALESHFFDDAATQLTASGISPNKMRSTSLKRGTSPRKVPKSGLGVDKENRRPEPKRARIGEKILLKDKVILRDILNDMTNGAY
ncbi:DNA replication ATP-dependent helicase/nuclease DNA2 [Colletotrichum tanaceti]|uniref:DNA replication ATP-dependent helicase/nuclease n=1 Tax=Colletotrichum tanaceti TaxID=1306861 RepID=A0A4U6XL98_9PEZI|nr:DNA replication ATP-dependent helicase/nuclease DNA2 [Colletotrichum tanaceti]KAJ0168267.1 DNA replication ATP-dependent helicase/nuclease DNA2 [Colletotrichum tanaceti]TKW56392.1 DNA replication ATP-dependent helicase/nuclease DNA2 [Colletotrichum tanaceti]